MQERLLAARIASDFQDWEEKTVNEETANFPIHPAPQDFGSQTQSNQSSPRRSVGHSRSLREHLRHPSMTFSVNGHGHGQSREVLGPVRNGNGDVRNGNRDVRNGLSEDEEDEVMHLFNSSNPQPPNLKKNHNLTKTSTLSRQRIGL